MLAWTLPPPVAPKKYTISVASSLSPSALGRMNSATRLGVDGAFEVHVAGAVNFSVAAVASGEMSIRTTALRISSIGSILAEDMRSHFLAAMRLSGR